MSWRTIVITKRAKLDLQLGYMVVRSDDITKISLNEIAMVLIESTSVSLTTGLLAELTKRKVKVVFCDEKRNPSSELIGYYGSHDTSNKIRKQIAWRQQTKEAVWTEIVTEKIRKQKELLEWLGKVVCVERFYDKQKKTIVTVYTPLFQLKKGTKLEMMRYVTGTASMDTL